MPLFNYEECTGIHSFFILCISLFFFSTRVLLSSCRCMREALFLKHNTLVPSLSILLDCRLQFRETAKREKRYSFPNVQVNHPCFSYSFPWRTRFILLFDVSCFPTSLVVSLYVNRCCCQTRPLADSVFIQVGFFYLYPLLLSLLFFDFCLVSFLPNSPF